jgi:hypothetical protein
MLVLNWKTAIVTAVCAVTSSLTGLGQQVAPVILRIEYENGVRYVFDSVDIPAFATVQTPVSQAIPTFATYVLLADVVAVNGQPAKGIFLTRQVVVNLTTSPSTGQAIADVIRTNVVDRIVEIQQPNGTPIGSIMTSGFDGGNPPPGAPAGTTGNFAITGGSGAFLGVRGQAAGGGLIIANRNASVREDPAQRRVNGGGKASLVLQLIPMSRPEIVAAASGPAVFHADFSAVSSVKPGKAGEVLITRATGLGPTRPGIDPGQPFPLDATQEVNSPVDVTVNGKSADVINKIGWPGLVDTYRVDFRVPDGTAPGTAAVQLTAAWIAGSSVSIPIQ